MGRTLTIHGMIDPHVHLRGMDWSHKGDFFTETSAAVAGGYWAVLDMPNTAPPTLTRTALDNKLRAIASQAVCDWGVYYCASAAGNWESFPEIIDDVCGVKMFNNATTGDLLVEDPAIRAGHYANWPAHKVFANHAEGETCAQIVDLVRRHRKPTHIVHVSTAEEVAIIRAAKADDLPVTAGVCPHHLFLTERDYERLGSLAWMKPGLKTQADQDALWQALRDGVLDVVESDHAPHTLEEKAADPAPYGVPGLETTLPLMLTAALDGRISLERLSTLLAYNPQSIWGISAPAGTYTVVDLDSSYIIDKQMLHTHVKWSPFEGQRVYGKVIETRIRGTKVYDGEEVLVSPGFGENVYGNHAS